MRTVMLLLFAFSVSAFPDSQRHCPRHHCVVTRRVLAAAHASGYPPYDALYGIATHNSYWIDRSLVSERGASGTQERILDQLLHEQVRALEIDIHFDENRPGVWSVYHTDKTGNSLCSPLDQCLKELQLFQYLVPEHEVVNLIIELKELWDHVFGPDHTIAQFDGLLRRYLGSALYTPRDFLARCQSGASLRECARVAGWPTIDTLRGKLIVNVIGNFNFNANDWLDYATQAGGVVARAAFPMRSILDSDGDGATGLIDDGLHDPFDPAQLRAADQASIFWQLEDLDYPGIDRFLDEHGVIRAGSSDTHADELDRIRRGFQLIQSDHPWHFVGDGAGPAGAPIDASRRLRDFGALVGAAPQWPAGALVEPGQRLYAVAGADAGELVATTTVVAPDSEWQTAPRRRGRRRRATGTSSCRGCGWSTIPWPAGRARADAAACGRPRARPRSRSPSAARSSTASVSASACGRATSAIAASAFASSRAAAARSCGCA
jgi:hypothetical protein